MPGKGNGCTGCVVLMVLLAGIGVGLAYHFTDGFQKPTDEALADATNAANDVGQKIKDTVDWDNLWPSLDHYFNEDPHRNVTGPDDADTWGTTRGQPGLKLHLLNALTEDWHAFYDVALLDWENGNPDVLTLTTETVEADFGCNPENQIDDVMKVCNGDYGDNGWRGLNTCIIVGGTIVSSVAQMNEFYLADASDEWKQYTMCHEIGHGFGLPHTDEEFWNRDLGNCLDYTNNPSSSMHPDITNFHFLAAMYGSIDGSIEAGANLTELGLDGVDRQLHEQEEESTRVDMSSSLLRKTTTSSNQMTKNKTPEWVYQSVKSIHEQLSRRRRLLQRQQRRNTDGGSLQVDLGEGYSVVIHLLHANANADAAVVP